MERAELIDHIYRSFEAAPRPKPAAIISCGCEECQDIKRDFGPHQAQDVPASTIEFHACAYALLTPEGFRYFLPRIIEVALEAENPKSSMVAEFLLYQLVRKGYLDPLAAAERSALSAYLEFRQLEGRFGYEPELYEALAVLGAG